MSDDATPLTSAALAWLQATEEHEAAREKGRLSKTKADYKQAEWLQEVALHCRRMVLDEARRVREGAA